MNGTSPIRARHEVFVTGGRGPLTAFECEAVAMLSVGGRGARGVEAIRTAIRAIGSYRLSPSGPAPSDTLSIPSRVARLARSGSAAASAAMCLSIVCLGAGLAQAAREPTNTFLTRQAVMQPPRIPISVFADEEAQPDEVAQAEQDDAVVPPVKRQRPVTPPTRLLRYPLRRKRRPRQPRHRRQLLRREPLRNSRSRRPPRPPSKTPKI